MSLDEWLEKVIASAPPLSAAQLAALRPACQQMGRHMQAAPAGARAASAITARTPERTRTA